MVLFTWASTYIPQVQTHEWALWKREQRSNKTRKQSKITAAFLLSQIKALKICGRLQSFEKDFTMNDCRKGEEKAVVDNILLCIANSQWFFFSSTECGCYFTEFITMRYCPIWGNSFQEPRWIYFFIILKLNLIIKLQISWPFTRVLFWNVFNRFLFWGVSVGSYHWTLYKKNPSSYHGWLSVSPCTVRLVGGFSLPWV